MSNKPLISGTVPASNVQPTLRLRPVLSLPRKDPTAQRLLLKMPPIQTMSSKSCHFFHFDNVNISKIN